MQRMIAVAELVPRTPDCMLGPRHQFIAARAVIGAWCFHAAGRAGVACQLLQTRSVELRSRQCWRGNLARGVV